MIQVSGHVAFPTPRLGRQSVPNCAGGRCGPRQPVALVAARLLPGFEQGAFTVAWGGFVLTGAPRLNATGAHAQATGERTGKLLCNTPVLSKIENRIAKMGSARNAQHISLKCFAIMCRQQCRQVIGNPSRGRYFSAAGGTPDCVTRGPKRPIGPFKGTRDREDTRDRKDTLGRKYTPDHRETLALHIF